MGARGLAAVGLGLALLACARPSRAQDAPAPAPSPAVPAPSPAPSLEDEVRELRERVRRLEAEAAARRGSPAGAPTTETAAGKPAGPESGEAQGAPPPQGSPTKPGSPEGSGGGAPGAGAPGPGVATRPGQGTVGPGQQEPERAPAPGLEERVQSAEQALRKAVGAAIPGLELHGTLDMDYVWNLNDPRKRRVDVNLLRVNDPDHDTFEVAWAKLALVRNVNASNEWDAGFHLAVAVGREVETTLSLDPHFLHGEAINLAQGYVDLQMPTPFGSPLLVRFGRFYSWFGAESLDTALNPNFSLSYFTTFTPFTTTGVGVGMDLALGFRYTQYLVNGWDVVVDDNDAKTVGGQLAWTHKADEKDAAPDVALALNWIWGPEQPRDDKHARAQVELDGTLRPFDATTFLGALGYGQEEHGAVARPVALVGGPGGVHGLTGKFGGAMAIVRQELGEVSKGFYRFAVAARVAYWRDQGGSKTGLDQALLDTTGTFELHFTEDGRLRFEVRRDGSTRRHAFVGRRGEQSRDEQVTVSVDAAFAF